MSELKDYWDKIDSSSVDSASIEEGVHDVVGRIRKQRTIQRSILATVGALPIFAICLFLFRPADTRPRRSSAIPLMVSVKRLP